MSDWQNRAYVLRNRRDSDRGFEEMLHVVGPLLADKSRRCPRCGVVFARTTMAVLARCAELARQAEPTLDSDR